MNFFYIISSVFCSSSINIESFLNSQISVFFFSQAWFLDEFPADDPAVSVFFLVNGGTKAPWEKMTTRLKGLLL